MSWNTSLTLNNLSNEITEIQQYLGLIINLIPQNGAQVTNSSQTFIAYNSSQYAYSNISHSGGFTLICTPLKGSNLTFGVSKDVSQVYPNSSVPSVQMIDYGLVIDFQNLSVPNTPSIFPLVNGVWNTSIDYIRENTNPQPECKIVYANGLLQFYVNNVLISALTQTVTLDASFCVFSCNDTYASANGISYVGTINGGGGGGGGSQNLTQVLATGESAGGYNITDLNTLTVNSTETTSLTVNNTSTFNGDITVNDNLTLTSGILTTQDVVYQGATHTSYYVDINQNSQGSAQLHFFDDVAVNPEGEKGNSHQIFMGYQNGILTQQYYDTSLNPSSYDELIFDGKNQAISLGCSTSSTPTVQVMGLVNGNVTYSKVFDGVFNPVSSANNLSVTGDVTLVQNATYPDPNVTCNILTLNTAQYNNTMYNGHVQFNNTLSNNNWVIKNIGADVGYFKEDDLVFTYTSGSNVVRSFNLSADGSVQLGNLSSLDPPKVYVSGLVGSTVVNGNVYDSYFNPPPLSNQNLNQVLQTGNNAQGLSATQLNMVQLNSIANSTLNTGISIKLDNVEYANINKTASTINALTVQGDLNAVGNVYLGDTNSATPNAYVSGTSGNGRIYDTVYNPIPTVSTSYMQNLNLSSGMQIYQLIPLQAKFLFEIPFNVVNLNSFQLTLTNFSMTVNVKNGARPQYNITYIWISNSPNTAYSATPTGCAYNSITFDASLNPVFTSNQPIVLYFDNFTPSATGQNMYLNVQCTGYNDLTNIFSVNPASVIGVLNGTVVNIDNITPIFNHP
jgi:hypothetical protein